MKKRKEGVRWILIWNLEEHNFSHWRLWDLLFCGRDIPLLTCGWDTFSHLGLRHTFSYLQLGYLSSLQLSYIAAEISFLHLRLRYIFSLVAKTPFSLAVEIPFLLATEIYLFSFADEGLLLTYDWDSSSHLRLRDLSHLPRRHLLWLLESNMRLDRWNEICCDLNESISDRTRTYTY